MTACLVCAAEAGVFYSGRIREGKHGDLSSIDHFVLECGACGARWLDGVDVDVDRFYESDSYRQSVDGSGEISAYFANHDYEQIRHLNWIGTDQLRGKTVADIGCGAGSFLNLVEGMAGAVIAVEPSETFRSALRQRRYATFAYARHALAECSGSVDLAVSFSVIEHVPDPVVFLNEIRGLLRPGGRLILSTPNADDVLLKFLPSEYGAFFYRRAHLWYWTSDALKRLLLRCGFQHPSVIPIQRFGIGNFIHWLRDRSPQGEKRTQVSTPAMDAVWRSELQRLAVSDYLVASAYV